MYGGVLFGSAPALMAVLMIPSKTLTLGSASLILLDSILVLVIIYVLAFKLEIKAIVFDP